MIESSIDEDIIQGVMNVFADDHDTYDICDSCVLPNVSPKEVLVTLNNYLLQHEKN